MHVQRSFVDNAFDRYVLTEGDAITRRATALSVPALAPLVNDPRTRKKAHWESRVFHNALTLDPFLSQSFGATVAYFVNASYQVVQVLDYKTRNVQLKSVYSLPQLTTRLENVSVQVAGMGFIVYCDGLGTLHFLAADADQVGATWRQVHQCAPWGIVPLLLLGASYDVRRRRLYAVVAEPLSGCDVDKAFQLATVDVLLNTPSAVHNAMEIGPAEVEPKYVTSSIAVVSKLPTHVSFSGPDVVVLVEGTFQLLMKELVAETPKQTSVDVASVVATDASVAHVHRRHDEDDLDESEMAGLLSTFPRGGIGFHGEITKPKEPSELASVDFKTPLSGRFHKSSTPFSSVATCLDATPHASMRHTNNGASSALDHPCEVPTAESIFSGFEECDTGDPNAKASLLLINCEQQVVRHRVDIDCLKFQFLCPSAHVQDAHDHKSALLFRNDVHGLIFEPSVINDLITLRHTATLPAFGFVQASKQEKKFMSCHASGSFACIGEFQRRVFIYEGSSSASERESHTRNQHIVEFGDQELYGLQIVDANTILVLTSSQVFSLQLSGSLRARTEA